MLQGAYFEDAVEHPPPPPRPQSVTTPPRTHATHAASQPHAAAMSLSADAEDAAVHELVGAAYAQFANGFAQLDSHGSGFVTGAEVRPVLAQSGLPTRYSIFLAVLVQKYIYRRRRL